MTHVDWFLVPCWGKSGGFYSVLDMGKGSLLGCTSWSSQSKVICGWVCVVLSVPHHSHEKYSAKRRSYPCSGPVSISNPGRQNSRCWGTWHEITCLACCSWEKLLWLTSPHFPLGSSCMQGQLKHEQCLPVYLFPKRVVLWLISLLANPEF